uniref:Uncharacterized protein n=1 Tax=Arundo donax TaxID=35708 RepID=A0A0A8ZX85_ARUDO
MFLFVNILLQLQLGLCFLWVHLFPLNPVNYALCSHSV